MIVVRLGGFGLSFPTGGGYCFLPVAILGAPNKAAAQSLPKVSISAQTSLVEGTDATFTLTLVRTGTTAAELLVAVSVQETGSILTSPSDTTVTFAVNHSTTTLSVATDDDNRRRGLQRSNGNHHGRLRLYG